MPNLTIEVRKRYTREQEEGTPPKKDDRYTLVDVDLFSDLGFKVDV